MRDDNGKSSRKDTLDLNNACGLAEANLKNHRSNERSSEICLSTSSERFAEDALQILLLREAEGDEFDLGI